MKKNLGLGIVILVLVAAVMLSFAFSAKQRKEYAGNLSKKTEEFSKEKNTLESKIQEVREILSEKEKELDLARKQNFQDDLMAAQSALKASNEKLSQALREHSSMENSKLVLENRLKNTTSELTRTLEELKKARETLAGIENQYKDRLIQLTDSVKLKEGEIKRLQSGSFDRGARTSGSSADFSDSMRAYQSKISELENTISSLNKDLSSKERILARREEELERYRKMPAVSRDISDDRYREMDKDRQFFEKQISDSNAKLLEQQDSLRDLEDRVSELRSTLAERESLLAERTEELQDRAREVAELRDELRSLKFASTSAPGARSEITKAQRELESRVRQLEEDKKTLERRLGDAKKMGRGKAEPEDLFADRNFRIMTETLVKKEEDIRKMEAELKTLRKEKAAHENTFGDREKRLAELEMLVATLTKQLGEYAGMVEQKDRELKLSNSKVDSLMQEIEAQKIASIALQKDLADARAKQEKTFNSLTKIMSINAEGGISSEGVVGLEDYDQASMGQIAKERPGDVRKRAEELRRRVEVLLEDKGK